jgi:hypothetical protein
MEFHYDTSLRFILEDDSISLAFKAHICSCSGKGVRLWLVARPFIHSFFIAHYTFTSVLPFCFGLIQPLASNLFTCECELRLDTSGTNLIRCPFGGQRIATYDTIQNIMYALVRKSGHTTWKKQWYALRSRVSSQADLYMT